MAPNVSNWRLHARSCTCRSTWMPRSISRLTSDRGFLSPCRRWTSWPRLVGPWRERPWRRIARLPHRGRRASPVAPHPMSCAPTCAIGSRRLQRRRHAADLLSPRVRRTSRLASTCRFSRRRASGPSLKPWMCAACAGRLPMGRSQRSATCISCGKRSRHVSGSRRSSASMSWCMVSLSVTTWCSTSASSSPDSPSRRMAGFRAMDRVTCVPPSSTGTSRGESR
ncbi:hypothetical protein D3C86_1432160 [compost metagenome]